jgi:RPA family protein
MSAAGNREVAYRLFATEFDDADFSYSESDEDRAPTYVVTPTGARVNRLFAVGVLTEVDQASEDVLRARVVDPTGAFVVYAGQYQPNEQAFLDRVEPPAFVSLTGKARTFQPDDADLVYTSVRPESFNEVDAETRDRWTVQTARQTLGRIDRMADALGRDERGDDLRAVLSDTGLDGGLASGIPLALDHYGTSPAYLEAMWTHAVQALEVVAGERDEVDAPDVETDASGGGDLSALRTPDLDRAVAGADSGQEATTGSDTARETTETDEAHEVAETDSESATASIDSPTQSPDDTVDPDGTESVAAADTATGDELEDFEPGEFDLDDDEREAVKEEYGTEFQSGTEVDDPGAADIEPEAADTDSEAADTDPGTAETDESVPGATGDPASTKDATTAEAGDAGVDETAPDDGDDDAADAADVDLEEAVMEAMVAKDDGDGAKKNDIVEAVVDRAGTDADAVEDAIQEALMDGRCYEPDDDRYKPI